MLKYKCIVLDHDDTIVDSTASVHYPAFIEALKVLRPGQENSITLEEYFKENFHGGFIPMCEELYGFTEADFDVEVEIWKSYVMEHVPKTFDGIKELLWKYKEAGGIITVVSHSFDFNIIRDYEANGLPKPDMIFGWECEPWQRKPATYGPEQIAKKYNLKPTDMVMIDDLKPGFDMAKAFGMDFIGAGWCESAPEIYEFMQRECQTYLRTVRDLEKYLFYDN